MVNFFVNEKMYILKETPQKKLPIVPPKFSQIPPKNANNQIPDQKKIKSKFGAIN
jgi:hypothetical protein